MIGPVFGGQVIPFVHLSWSQVNPRPFVAECELPKAGGHPTGLPAGPSVPGSRVRRRFHDSRGSMDLGYGSPST